MTIELKYLFFRLRLFDLLNQLNNHFNDQSFFNSITRFDPHFPKYIYSCVLNNERLLKEITDNPFIIVS